MARMQSQVNLNSHSLKTDTMKHPKQNALDQILHSKYESEGRRLEHLYELQYRRTGSTTRVIDDMVQQLFTDGEVKASVSHRGISAERDTWSRFLRRVDIEHGGLSNFVVNHAKMTIKWPGFKVERDIRALIDEEIKNFQKKQKG